MFDAAWGRRLRLGADAGPLIGLRVWVGSGLGLFRIGPAWAVLAGALVSGGALFADAMPLRLVGAALLADSVWGVLWRMTASAADLRPDGSPGATADGLSRLPYYQTGSPAGQALRLLRDMIAGATWHELAAAIALAAVLGLLLGIPALLLTVVAWGVTLWGWLLAQSGRQPAACDALLNVGLPWLLGLALAGPAPAGVLAAAPAGTLPLPGLALGLAFTALGWGARRAFLSQGRRRGGIWLGQAAVILALIALQQTAALIIAPLLLAPPAWLIWRAAGGDVRDALARSGPWWLAAMLVAAIALISRSYAVGS